MQLKKPTYINNIILKKVLKKEEGDVEEREQEKKENQRKRNRRVCDGDEKEERAVIISIHTCTEAGVLVLISATPHPEARV